MKRGWDDLGELRSLLRAVGDIPKSLWGVSFVTKFVKKITILIMDYQFLYPNDEKGSHGYVIKTEHLPDGTWKACLEGTETVHYAKTKMDAIAKILDVILPEKNQEDMDEA